ncbi:hypothetical protein LCGC14_3163480, partial [marine sediment metagenome]
CLTIGIYLGEDILLPHFQLIAFVSNVKKF